MREDLLRIERIERYLEGQMDGSEKEQFEEEMHNDPELKRDVELQNELQKGITRQALKTEIQQAHQRFMNTGGAGGAKGGNFFSSAKFFALLGGAAVLAILTFWFTQTREGNETVVASPELDQNATIADTFDAAIPSQIYTVNPKEEQVITANNGTRFYIPEWAFLNNGKPERKTVNLEVKEGLGMDDMILGNLNTTDENGNPLQSGGMVYLDAKNKKGEPLTINPEKPIYIEVPTKLRVPGMKIYTGKRGNNGNFIWSPKKKPENYLVTVPLDELNFYPPGFEEAVAKGLPYKGHKEATKELMDSLYYSLKPRINSYVISQPTAEFEDDIDSDLDLNEAYYRGNNLKDGKYTNESFENTADADEETVDEDWDYSLGDMACRCIKPPSIKTINQEKFANSFIATREFEERLQAIFSTCSDEFIQLYVMNLDKDLWVSDSIAAIGYDESMNMNCRNCDRVENPFYEFVAQKLTNVKGAELYANMLKKTYAKDLTKFNKEIEKAEKAYQKELQKADAKIEKVKEKYREVLVKREAKRMTTYGFEWSETGWLNVDVGTVPKPAAKPIDVKLVHNKKPTRSYAYFSFTSINSIYRLNYDKAQDVYYPGFASTHSMDMPAYSDFTIVAVSYYGDSLFLATKELQTDFGGEVTLTPTYYTEKEARKLLKSLSYDNRSNSITRDLGYQEKFYLEKLRREKIKKEEVYIQSLRDVAFPCCKGEQSESGHNVEIEKVYPKADDTNDGITVVDANGNEKIILKKDNPALYKKLLEQSKKGSAVDLDWGPRERKPEQDQR
ncbi:MAG: hypothetical protein KDC92_06315 [Bacteroidetes bacterium]|nr:hypothetical protein [Bacteroidota bacterium]